MVYKFYSSVINSKFYTTNFIMLYNVPYDTECSLYIFNTGRSGRLAKTSLAEWCKNLGAKVIEIDTEK